MKKKLLLILVPILTELAFSCCNCRNISETHKVFEYKDVEIYSLDNSGKDPVLTIQNTLPKNAYGIQLTVKNEQIATRDYKSLFIPTTKACKCIDNSTSKFTYYLDSIKIITLNDFDATHLANSDITEYFNVLYYHKYYSIYDKTIFINYNKLNMFLMKTPTTNDYQQFKVIVKFSNGRIEEKFTHKINFI